MRTGIDPIFPVGTEMRFDHWELGFCYLEWEIKSRLGANGI